MDTQERKKLELLSAKTEQTLGDVVRMILRDPKLTELLNQVEARGYKRGMDKWFGKAYIPCKVCGKSFTADFIGHAEQREVLHRAFASWGHSDCINSGR